MARFVVLFHDWPEPHFDLLVEVGDHLRAWRLWSEPRAGNTIAAEPNFPHRPLYLEYEGPLSGDRGSVSRWDAGTYTWGADEPERVEMDVQGAKLVGRAVLWRTGEGWAFRLTGSAGGG